jgi:erythromycin esterase-like protein
VDPDTALLARKFYGTLSSFGEDGFDYTRSLLNGSISQQKDNVAKMLAELNKNELDYVKAASNGDEFFSAFENSFIISTAESYYRNFLPGGEDTWSIRDTAMADIVGHALKWHTRKYGKVCRAVIWAHNSHICNDSNSRVTLGHLMRQRFACYTIGFSTNTGTVRAAREWGGPDLVLDLKPSISDSAGDLFHRVGLMRTLDFGVFFANLTDKQRSVLGRSMWQRFVGVQYLRETELASHYSKCSMTNQYDMMIHIDKTTAVKRVSDGIDYSKWEHIDEYDSAEDY